MATSIGIGGKLIGRGHPIFIVAELSANHHHEFDNAVRLVKAAHSAGADAVKLQTYTPDTLTMRSTAEAFRIGPGTAWTGRYLYDLYTEASTPWEWYPRLRDEARDLGLQLFSTPFDNSAVEYLERAGAPAYKIASFELVDLPLLRCVGATGKPVILSTGMATLEEINEAVETLAEAGADELALLKCTSAYPAEPAEMNLRTIPDMAARFGVPVGLSDHTLSSTVPVAAVALGACIIEKHLTLSRSIPGPDSAFSLEPQEFRAMTDAVRTAQEAMGDVLYGPTERERPSLVFRRSLFVVAPVRRGEAFTTENIRAIRPGYGMHTRHLSRILGLRAAQNVAPGTPLTWELVEGTDPGPPGKSDPQ